MLAMLQNLLGMGQLDAGDRERLRQAMDQLTAGRDRIPGAFPGEEDHTDDDEVTVTATAEVDEGDAT